MEGTHWVLHRIRRNGEKQSGSRTIREPTWYFQSKLLVSYNRKDNTRKRDVSMKFRGAFALFFEQSLNALVLFSREWEHPCQDDCAREHQGAKW